MGSRSAPPLLKKSVEDSKCEYRQLGKSGLRISVPIFGCMSFGDPRTVPWAIGEEEVFHPRSNVCFPRTAHADCSILGASTPQSSI